MRENAAAMDKLIAETRTTPPQNMTAVAELKMYRKFAQTHVDALKNEFARLLGCDLTSYLGSKVKSSSWLDSKACTRGRRNSQQTGRDRPLALAARARPIARADGQKGARRRAGVREPSSLIRVGRRFKNNHGTVI